MAIIIIITQYGIFKECHGYWTAMALICCHMHDITIRYSKRATQIPYWKTLIRLSARWSLIPANWMRLHMLIVRTLDCPILYVVICMISLFDIVSVPPRWTTVGNNTRTGPVICVGRPVKVLEFKGYSLCSAYRRRESKGWKVFIFDEQWLYWWSYLYQDRLQISYDVKSQNLFPDISCSHLWYSWWYEAVRQIPAWQDGFSGLILKTIRHMRWRIFLWPCVQNTRNLSGRRCRHLLCVPLHQDAICNTLWVLWTLYWAETGFAEELKKAMNVTYGTDSVDGII